MKGSLNDTRESGPIAAFTGRGDSRHHANFFALVVVIITSPACSTQWRKAHNLRPPDDGFRHLAFRSAAAAKGLPGSAHETCRRPWLSWDHPPTTAGLHKHEWRRPWSGGCRRGVSVGRGRWRARGYMPGPVTCHAGNCPVTPVTRIISRVNTQLRRSCVRGNGNPPSLSRYGRPETND